MMLRPWQIRANAEDAATMTPGTMTVMERCGELLHLPGEITRAP
jgi:hypothetical protein